MAFLEETVKRDLVLYVENGRCSSGSNWEQTTMRGEIVLRRSGGPDGYLGLLRLGLVGASPGAPSLSAHRIALSAYAGSGTLTPVPDGTVALELALTATFIDTQAGCSGIGLRPKAIQGKLTGIIREMSLSGIGEYELTTGVLELSSDAVEEAAVFEMSVDLATSRMQPLAGLPATTQRILKLQPVQFPTPGSVATGAQWPAQLAQAQSLWGQCCIRLEGLQMIDGAPTARSSTDRCKQIKALPHAFPHDAIPVFYVDDPLAGDGGGWTDLAGTGLDAIFISSQIQDNTVLAHELGHVLGGSHPGGNPPGMSASAWVGDTNTILVPGNGHASPKHNSTHNCQCARHALLITQGPVCTFHPDLP